MGKRSLAWLTLALLFGPRFAVAAETVPISQVVKPYLGDGLELAVIPSPREVDLSDRLLVAPRLEIDFSSGYKQPATVADARRFFAALKGSDTPAAAIKVCLGEIGDGGPADRIIQAVKLVPSAEKQTAMGEQGYVLFVGNLGGRDEGVIAVAGVGPAGTYYGLQSLKQLTVIHEGKVFVRTGKITDWPAMPWRGSKRPLAWEELYKANFGVLRGEDNKDHFRISFGAGADPQRQLKSWELGTAARNTASKGLDVSDALIDALAKQFEAEYRKSGNRLFGVKGDDVELALDEKSGTRARFKDNYGAAFVHLLTELNKRLKKVDPGCTIYWMPNPYYTVNWDFELLSRQVREAGGLPGDVGLWWTGHYVFSPMMTEADIHGYQKGFYGTNPITVHGFIYDNHGRADESGRAADYFAMPARDPRIAKHLMGMSNERGTWVNRITSYDFQWNPEVYNPVRSLKLALRELANRDPSYYKVLLDFVTTWEAGRYPSARETTHDAVLRQQKAFLARLAELRPRLQAESQRALKDAAFLGDPRDGDFRKQFPVQVVGSIATKEGFFASINDMWRDGTGPAHVIPAAEAPRIDGKLDDACYQRPPTLDRFVTPGGRLNDPAKKSPLWEVKPGSVPAELSTQAWFLADDKNFYMAFRCNDTLYPRAPGQAVNRPVPREKVGNDHPYCWRQWCLDVNLDVKHDQVNTFHIVVDALGQVYDEYLGWPGDPLPTGAPWTMGENVKVVRDGDSWTMEAAIPLEKLGLKQVKPGDIWGANVYRPGMNVVSMFSLLKDTGPYGGRYPRVFGRVHWK